MNVSLKDAWVFSKILAGQTLNGELDAVSIPYRHWAKHIHDLPADQRSTAMASSALVFMPLEELAAIELAAANADPNGPAPVEVATAKGPSWPDPIEAPALQGVTGDMVRVIEPTTEADPHAILSHALVMFGSMIGKGPFVMADGHRHRTNEYVVDVGETSRARKGTGGRRARDVFAQVDPHWVASRVAGGLSSGEGLVWAIRDPIEGLNKKTGAIEILDAGISDKRFLAMEDEFGNVLRVLAREGNTLSGVLRKAWDSDQTLQSITKNNPAVCQDPHVSLIGHITCEELEKHLSSVEAFNGLGNRVLWVCVRRSKELPFGGRPNQRDMQGVETRMADIANDAKQAGEIRWASTGAAVWESSYSALTAARRGMLGAMTARAEAHVLRLSMIYALLDKSREIADDHVHAALAFWKYCDQSAAFLFSKSTGSKHADSILAALKSTPAGMTRTEIQVGIFGKHGKPEEIGNALELLATSNLAHCAKTSTGGRPAERWFAA